MSGYPFAVARNRDLDWRPVLAPEPLVAAGQAYSLVLETAGMHPIPVTARPWRDGSGREWTLLFRSVPARAEFVGEDGDELTDRFGRRVFLVEGVAFPEHREIGDDGVLDDVHADAVAAFRAFWPVDDESFTPRPSAPLAVAGEEGTDG